MKMFSADGRPLALYILFGQQQPLYCIYEADFWHTIRHSIDLQYRGTCG